MPTLLHHSLPKGSQLELLNVSAMVARRDNDDPDSDYILMFEDAKEDVKVYVPMSPNTYREWITAQAKRLSRIVPATELQILNGGKR